MCAPRGLTARLHGWLNHTDGWLAARALGDAAAAITTNACTLNQKQDRDSLGSFPRAQARPATPGPRALAVRLS